MSVSILIGVYIVVVNFTFMVFDAATVALFRVALLVLL